MKPPAHLLLQFTTTSSPTSKHLQSDPFAHPALASCQRRRHGRRGDVHARAAACVVRGPVHDSEVRPRARPARDPRRRRRKGPHSQGGRRQAAGVQARQPVGAVHGRPHAPAARLLQRRVLRRRGPRGQGQRRRTGNEDGVSMGPFHVLANDKLFMHAWSFLTEAVVDGGSPFNKAFDTPSWFDYASTDARFNHVFNVAMKDHSVILSKKLLELYKGFDGVRTLVDVGGGLGSTIHAITSRYPSINGINFDLPHVIAEAPEYHQDVKVKHVGGDMFKEVPAGADAILIKWILNCWGDEHFVTLLKNCYQALPANGKVINIECILPVKPEATKSAQALIGVDMQLLAYSPDGKERYKGEFVQLAKRAGFTSVNFTYIFANFWAIEYIK